MVVGNVIVTDRSATFRIGSIVFQYNLPYLLDQISVLREGWPIRMDHIEGLAEG
jgi:hypothetical protein